MSEQEQTGADIGQTRQAPRESIIATRATMHEAKRHFEAGGAVLVSEYGHEPTQTVTASTTTHDRTSTTWDDLAETVNMWRNRYPNQRFYIVPTVDACTCSTDEDDIGQEQEQEQEQAAPTMTTMSYTDRFGHKSSLPYVVESTASTVMVLGTYLGASVIVFGGDSYDSAYDAGLSYMADLGMLATAEEPTDPDDHEGMDYVDGHGYMVTADIMAWRLIGLD